MSGSGYLEVVNVGGTSYGLRLQMDADPADMEPAWHDLAEDLKAILTNAPVTQVPAAISQAQADLASIKKHFEDYGPFTYGFKFKLGAGRRIVENQRITIHVRDLTKGNSPLSDTAGGATVPLGFTPDVIATMYGFSMGNTYWRSLIVHGAISNGFSLSWICGRSFTVPTDGRWYYANITLSNAVARGGGVSTKDSARLAAMGETLTAVEPTSGDPAPIEVTAALNADNEISVEIP